MARLSLRSIKAEVTALGIEKVGYTAYYVDGTNGSDSYDGLTWETAFATIQHAVDESESWAKIYVKSGTYAEDITISEKNGINIIGENKNNTIIQAIAGDGINIDVLSAYCTVESFTLRAVMGRAVMTQGHHTRIKKCVVGSTGGGSGILVGEDADYSIFEGIDIDQDNVPGFCVDISGTLLNYVKFCIVRNCYVYGTSNDGIALSAYAENCLIYNNTIENVIDKGIQTTAGSRNNSVFHNNLINNGTQVRDDGTGNNFFENFYDDHTVDTNNDGLCDTPYTFTTGTDYSPVSKRNGWLQESLGMTPSSAITTSNIFDIVNGILTLSETGGTITTNGALQTVYINNAPAGIYQPRKLLIDFTNHVAGDIMVIRIYYRISAAGGLIKQDEDTIIGVQDPEIVTIDLEDNRFGYQITIEKTVGANLTYDWEVVYKI